MTEGGWPRLFNGSQRAGISRAAVSVEHGALVVVVPGECHHLQGVDDEAGVRVIVGRVAQF